MSSIFLNHGGGPYPILHKEMHAQLYKQLEDIRLSNPKPKAIIIFSAHWEEKEWTILDNNNPGLFYDYYGFPPQTYKYKYPATSTSELRQQVESVILKDSGIKLNKQKNRGYDHGVFIPLMIMYPQTNIPVIQISLLQSLDPQKHYLMGKAVRSLKKNGYLIIGSGSSIHGGFMEKATYQKSISFNKELSEICLKVFDQRQLVTKLKNWNKLPHAKYLHPREQHLIPLFICLGAKQGHQSQKNDLDIMGVNLSSYIFH